MVVIVIGSGIGFLIWYRKRKFETELMAASWKVNYSDIVFTKDAKVSQRTFTSRNLKNFKLYCVRFEIKMDNGVLVAFSHKPS